ncbi:rhomboid family intramembrane serine protease [Streptomyces orinoci]|uniref:Rhomboid family intramembrane serine protease n=1 Tax=Streptomyces orinoci TaxID=67339 RepID=A0ABV3K250_STRON|nr:rhomboid family intramembrane serine protease [Streptomyces orinoci]
MNDQAVCCYRHPDREAGVCCARCDRRICPDCMVSASVGFQCPECVAGPSGGARRPADSGPRTVAGGSHHADPALVTKIILGINVAVWIAVLAVGDDLVTRLELFGRFPLSDDGLQGVAEGQWYRLLTSVFLHQSPAHIGFNMLSLWWLGPPLEAAFGRARYLALYLLSGLGGSALTYLVAPPDSASLGASGAIFGLLGATAVLMRRLNYDMRPVLALLVLNLIFTFTWSNIAWQAHIGGLVVGSAVAYGMVHAPRGKRLAVQLFTCGAALAAIAAMVLVRTFQLG